MGDLCAIAQRPHPTAVQPDSIPVAAVRPRRAPSVYEFFAGGGMARVGLGPTWRCLFANDIDPAKAAAYADNFGRDELRMGDIADVDVDELPETADLMWGSFPCQDLSLAGAGAGLQGARSGAFHLFWRLVEQLGREGRAPRLVAVENVCGTLTSQGGRDFAVLCAAFVRGGYRLGALVVDARLFTPQSRPRLFLVGVHEDMAIPAEVLADGPSTPFHPAALRRAFLDLPAGVAERWLWWRLPAPPPRTQVFADLLEPAEAVVWRGEAQTARLLSLMSPHHLAKVEAACRSGRRCVGGVYRRTRPGADGLARQRAEVRFDEVAGCLRTPAGGSSRQTLLVVEGAQVRSRLLSPREAARLMGLPDSYRLPARASAAYHLTGDGVAAPVVAHLARHLFEPLLGGQAATPADLAA